jgi:hypothetical protein
LRASDRARARFVRESFDADIDAPYHYDLVLNTAELAPEEAAEVILLATQRKSQHRLAPPDAPRDFLSHVMRFRRRPRFPRVSEIVWRRCERRSAF